MRCVVTTGDRLLSNEEGIILSAKAKAWVCVSDERPEPGHREFHGIALADCEKGEVIPVAVFVTDSDNGFGWEVGSSVQFLKELENGKFGS